MKKKVQIKGYEFTVEFDYQPAERMTRHYPGCSEDVYISLMWDEDGDEVKGYAYEMLEGFAREACLEAVARDREDAEIERAEYAYELWKDEQIFRRGTGMG